MNPARFFAIASLCFGLALILLTPPFCTPDEPAHLYRAWSIGRGHFRVHGGDAIPRSIVDSASAMLRLTRGPETAQVTWQRIFALGRRPLRPNDTVFVPMVPDPGRQPLAYTAPSYTPIGYIATAPAVAVGRMLNASPIALVYLGRIANLIVASAVIMWAISIAPFGRWLLTLIALTPMAVFMRGALSIDALTMAFAIALIAALIAARRTAGIVLTFVVCAIKPGYLLIPLLSFAVPQLRRRRGVMLLIFVAIMAGTALAAVWVRSADLSFPTTANARLTTLLHEPMRYVADLASETQRDAKLIAVQIAANFGWLDAPAPLTFAGLWLTGIIAVAVIDGPASLTTSGRICSLVVFAGSVFFLMTLLHLGTQGKDFFSVQGRYFLPLIPLALLPLAMFAIREDVKMRTASLFTAVAIAQSLWTLTSRYWI